MNKAELVDKLMGTGEFASKAAATRALEAVFESTAEALEKGDEVAIPRFGKFKVTERAARVMRNPHTGDPIDVPAKKVVKFSPAAALKTRVDV